MKYSTPIKVIMFISYAFAALVLLEPLLSIRQIWPGWYSVIFAWAFILLAMAIGFIYSELAEICKKLDESQHREGHNPDLSK